MGMRKMFTDEADFSGISECRLKVSKVVQKAFIQVNEEGSEAAALTRKSLKLLLHVFSAALEKHKSTDVQLVTFCAPFICIESQTFGARTIGSIT